MLLKYALKYITEQPRLRFELTRQNYDVLGLNLSEDKGSHHPAILGTRLGSINTFFLFGLTQLFINPLKKNWANSIFSQARLRKAETKTHFPLLSRLCSSVALYLFSSSISLVIWLLISHLSLTLKVSKLIL